MNQLREIVKDDIFYLEEKEQGKFLAKIVAAFGEADKKNQNGRTYPYKTLKKAVEQFNKKLEKANALGQVDHPISGGTELSKASHVILKTFMLDKTPFVELGVLDTQRGRDTLNILKSGCDLGMSLRAYGKTDPLGVVQDDLSLQSLDIVTNPSFSDSAKLSAKNIIESYVVKDEEIEELEEGDGDDFEEYVEPDSEERLAQRLEEAEKKHADLLKRAGEFENKKSGKMKPKGLTLEDIKKHRPDLLREHEKEILSQDMIKVYNAFLEAVRAGYPGSLKQYLPIYESSRRKTEEEDARQQQRKLEEQKKREDEFKRLGGTHEEIAAYNEYVFSADRRGVKTFKEWKHQKDNPSPEVRAQRTLRILREEAQKNIKILDEEARKKNALKRYHKDVEKGLFEGSFTEWLTLKEQEDTEKLAQRTYREAQESGFVGTFNQYREILKNRKKK